MPKEDNFTPKTDYRNLEGKTYPAGVNGRLDFSKISEKLPLPNLVEIQTNSYEQFLATGIDDVLNEVFPIPDYNKELFIEYVSKRLEAPRYTPLDCKMGDQTYSSKLKVTLRLRFKNTGEIKEAEVFMGDIPLMTDSGTFIINGSERVIISQIVRSSGAYFDREQDRKSGMYLYSGELHPGRGTWFQAESDTRNTIYFRMDRQFKFPAHVFFMALGLENPDDFTRLFGHSELLESTMAKDTETRTMAAALLRIYAKLKPGEPSTPEGRVEFLRGHYFDNARYDLGPAGRFFA